MAMKWNDLKHKASPAKREQAKRDALVELETLEKSGMAVLRMSRRQTQVDVAEQMQIPQSAVSRIERQADCRVSTLQRYVRALGGQLEMRAVFPDDTVTLDDLMEPGEKRRAG